MLPYNVVSFIRTNINSFKLTGPSSPQFKKIRKPFVFPRLSAYENMHNSQGRAQRIRLTRLYMAIATYFMIVTITCLISELSYWRMPVWAMVFFISYGIIGNAIFFILIRSGLNLRFKDPSLTQQQLIFASIGGLLPIYYFHDARVLCQICYLPAFSFGMLRLNLKQYLFVVLVMMATYCTAVFVDYYSGRTDFSVKIELFQIMVFFMILLWFAFFGGFISSLRNRLRKKYKELEAARKIIEKQAQTDELTQLFNRRHAREVMKTQKKKADEGSHHFSIAMIDLDHFKLVNDRFGHEIGDEVLRQFSTLCENLLRAEDQFAALGSTLARYGGEEFIIILPSTNSEETLTCINRIRLAMKDISIPGTNSRITFSAGVALHQKGEGVDSLIKRTDQALYKAKSEGRNRVSVSINHPLDSAHP